MVNQVLKSLKSYKLIRLLIILLAFSVQHLAANAADMIIATVDKKEIYLGDVVKLNLSISDPNLKIKFPQDTPDYTVVASSVSSSFQIINGVTSKNKTISYVVKPLRAGNINLPEATANDGTNSYKSQNIVIKVTAGNKITKLPSSKTQTSTKTQTTSTPTSKTKSVFAKVKINNTNPYINEQVHLSLKIYHRGNLVEINPATLQIPLTDFVKKMDTKAKEYKEVVDGLEYLVYQLDYTLFPLKSGSLVIPEHELQGIVIEDAPLRRSNFDPFRIVNPFIVKKPVHFSTKQLRLNVKPIPAGQPANYQGYVGDLAVTHQISKLEIDAGEALTLTTKIYGSGSANSVDKDLIRDSKQYSLFKDKEESSEEINNSILYFETVINTAIVPNKNSGRISIETNPLVSFNPKTGAFEEHGKEVFEITIIPGKAKDKKKNSIQQEKKKEAVKKEILSSSQDQIMSYKEKRYNSNNVLLLIAFINLIYFAYIIIRRIKKLPINNNTKHKTILKDIQRTTDIAELSTIFKDFVNKRGEITNKETQEKVNSFLSETDSLNYSGKSAGNEKLEELKASAQSLIKELMK